MTFSPEQRYALRRLVLFTLILAAAGLVAWRLGAFAFLDRSAVLATVRRVRGMPLLAPAFVAAYAVAVTFGFPATMFTLAGGVLFGFGTGLLLNWMGATIGATLAFLFARTLCGGGCRSLLGRHGDALARLAADHGFVSTLRLRVIPVVPFTLVNFGAALAGVRLRDYLLATALGELPAAAVYTWFADSLLRGAAGAGRDAFIRVAIAGTLLIALSFAPALVGRMRGR